MFRHKGRNRTYLQNIKLASLLSFVAGTVNVIGYFALHKLTTNVTGHFAFFANEVVYKDFKEAWEYLFYIISFFFGAFMSSFLIETVASFNGALIYIIPIIVEIAIITSIAFLPYNIIQPNTAIIACFLLFAMGLQNALVTTISNAVVRTTHLTGLFTDLGIELSQLAFYTLAEQKKKLSASIRLRLVIICFFFLGCISGGYMYFKFGIKSLLLASICLLYGVGYDSLKYRVVSLKRKYLPHD